MSFRFVGLAGDFLECVAFSFGFVGSFGIILRAFDYRLDFMWINLVLCFWCLERASQGSM